MFIKISNIQDKCFRGQGCIFLVSAANIHHGTERSSAVWSSQTTWPHGQSADQNMLLHTWLLLDCPTYSIIH